MGILIFLDNREKLEEIVLDMEELYNEKNEYIILIDKFSYGKYKFEQAKKEKEAKKKQKVSEVKEIRITPNTEEHDFNFKAKNARKFLEDGCKVKITVRFRGREMTHMELGREVIEKFCEALSECGNAEKKPILEGRFMSVILSPLKPEKK